MTTSYRGHLNRGGGIKKILAVSATALLTTLAVTVPAWAMPAGEGGIRDGKNIAVFHDSDFIVAMGYTAGDPMTVEVLRNNVVIGTASGPAQVTDEGVGLEVNHGPEGDPLPGDCWTGVTPDILPGDLIRITDSAGTDELLVDNITIKKGPIDDTSTEDPSDVYLEGRAALADGTPIPIEDLNSGEMRHVGPVFRATPSSVERIPGTTDGWRATYKAPYAAFKEDPGLTPEQQKQAILNGDHAMGYGHVDPVPPEMQIAENAPGGPALGCEGSPQQRNAVDTADDAFVNLTSGTLVLGGTAVGDATAVTGTISDEVGGSIPFSADSLTEGVNGQKNWTATVDRAALETLADGMLTIRGQYSVEGTNIGGRELEVRKDVVAPAITANHPSGSTHNGSVDVTLSSDGGEQIRYTTDGSPVGDGSQSYNGQPISLNKTGAINTAATDAAGNRGEASFSYTIRQATDLTLSGPAALSFGQSATLSGKLSSAGVALANKPVILEQRAASGGAFSQVGAPKNTLADGGFSFTGIKPNANTIYRVRFAQEAELQPKAAARQIKVRALVSNNTATSNLKLGKVRNIVGKVSPVHAGKVVRVTVKRPGQPTLVRNVRLSAASVYKFSYKPNKVGRYSVSVQFAGDADHLGGRSVLKSFRVIR